MSEHDQRCVMMADAVFETLRDYNARFVDEARENGIVWSKRWEALQTTLLRSLPPIAGMSASTKSPWPLLVAVILPPHSTKTTFP
jgi:hypothetical protein